MSATLRGVLNRARVRGAARVLSSAARSVERGARQMAVEGRLRRFPAPRRLHLACGRVHLDGWVNIDENPGPAVDLTWDLRLGVPGRDGSAEIVYCEHFLEHLSPSDGVAFLRDCRRVLRPGGTLRIAMPSLGVILDRVAAGRWRDQDWLTWPGFQHVSTRAEMLNMVFREWGHQWMYDEEELTRRLKEAGFDQFSFVTWGESQNPLLRKLETRKDSLLVCEVIR